jgi:hypothetical protein
VRLLNHATWEPSAQLAHPEALGEEGGAAVAFYDEVEDAPVRAPLAATCQVTLQARQPPPRPAKPLSRPRWGA